MKGQALQRYIPILFAIFFLATMGDIIKNFFPSLGVIKLMAHARFPSLLLLVFLHGMSVLGRRRAFTFFSAAFLFSLAAELLGSCCGLIFGRYTYASQPFMVLGLVPLLTPFFWMAVVYTAFAMTYLFHNAGRQNKKFLLPSLLLSALDGLVVMNIDMISEPISVLQGRWVWVENGPYFGIPILNFIGWWLVTFLITLSFRFYDRKNETKTITNSFSFIPVGTYFLIFARQFFMAIGAGHPEYALIGVASMLPVVLVFLYIAHFKNWK